MATAARGAQQETCEAPDGRRGAEEASVAGSTRPTRPSVYAAERCGVLIVYLAQERSSAPRVITERPRRRCAPPRGFGQIERQYLALRFFFFYNQDPEKEGLR